VAKYQFVFEGCFSGPSGADDCIERIAESINYAHSRVDKVITGSTDICLFPDSFLLYTDSVLS